MAELWCRPCDQNHTFTTGDIERIVYHLTAEAQTRLASDPEQRDLRDETLCLNYLHGESLDQYDRSPEVDEAVEARRNYTALGIHHA